MATIRAMPVIDVRDVEAAEAFWIRAGFASHGTWGDPPAFAILQRGAATLALSRATTEPPPCNGWWAAYVYLEDVAALHAEFWAEGLEPGPIRTPEHYGCRDFGLIDRTAIASPSARRCVLRPVRDWRRTGDGGDPCG